VVSIHVFHDDCVACRVVGEAISAVEQTIVLLAMLTASQSTVESITADLCFKHRRMLEQVVKHLEDEA
jgi:hypothetical protein